MENIFDPLYEDGFIRVEALDGEACGAECRRLILGFVPYPAALPAGHLREAVIHPYYPVSQKAYRAARAFADRCAAQGIDMKVHAGVHIKSLMNRLPFLNRGRNTLAYLPGIGSRFHVQILVSEDMRVPVTAQPLPEPRPPLCGECLRCLRSCPTGAIQPEGFQKERCIRFWMMNGQIPPEEIARAMGNRLLGCDACEECCPHNPGGEAEPLLVPLRAMLEDPKALRLGEIIGTNYAIPNRITAQACLITGAIRRDDLAGLLETIRCRHASPLCRRASELALRIMQGPTK